MAVSKRKKKPVKKVKPLKRKGAARVRAAQGGKSKSRASDPNRDLGVTDDVLDLLSRLTVGGSQDELIAQGQRDFPGLNSFSQGANTQHLASAENAARKSGPLAALLQKLGGGAVEVFEAFTEDTNNPDRPNSAEDTALDFAANRIGRQVGTSKSPENVAARRASGVSELNRLRAGIQDGSIDPFQLQRDEAPIAGRIAQIPNAIDTKVIPGIAKGLGVDANTDILGTVGKFLRGAPKSRPSSSIPRGKHGGRLTAEAAKSGRKVARRPVGRQRFAVGGASAASRLGKSTSDTKTDTAFEDRSDTTTRESGTGFTQNIADTGALDSIIGQLRGIQGFSGLGRSTLDDVLRSGLPTDVSGITEAAKIRASQEFDDASNVIGERLANLGLVSSSAQTTAVARERAKLGERVSAAGMEAQVAAAEAASGRRVQGLGLDTSGQGVRAGALGQAGSLARDSASLNSRQETGFRRRGSDSTRRSGTGSSKSSGSSVNPLFGSTPPSGSSRFPTSRSARSGRSGSGSGLGNSLRGSSGGGNSQIFGTAPGKPRIQLGSGSRAGAAEGGRVPELDDVLGGILQGNFRPRGVEELTNEDRLAAERGRIGRFEEGNIGLQNSRQEINEFLSENDPGILRMLLGGPGGAGALNVADPGTNVTPEMQANIDRSAKRSLAGARRPVPRQNFALGGPVEGDPEPIVAPNKGAVPQPTLPQEAGQVIPGLLDPRRQFFDEGGGVAPGEDTGDDKVPAMLRAEELVVTPELTEELMNVDPGLPQPGLITALQQLAQQPLEFGEEEGEFVAAGGGTIPGQFGIPIPGAQGQGGAIGADPLGFQRFLDFINRQGSAQVDPATGQIVIDSPPGPRDGNVPEFAGDFLPGAGEPSLDAVLREEPDFGPDEFTTSPGAFRLPSLTESVGKAGERSFTLEGGTPGAGVLGEAGVRAGIDSSKGLVGGGEGFAPGAQRVGADTIGSAVITDPETGLPMDFSGQQLSRVDRAQRVADLTRSAIVTDPIGGPKKQARMLRALEVANREVDSAVNEIIQGEQIAIQRQQVANQGIVAEGQLQASLARTLTAQAQKVTAEGALAKQVLEAQANNPVLTAALNALEILAKNPDADDDTRDQILAVLQFQLQQAGIELADSGFLAGLFGAPGFEIARSTPEQGVPTQAPNGRQGFADGGVVQPDGEAGQVAVANDGNQELQALMSRAKAGMSAEDFQHIMEIM